MSTPQHDPDLIRRRLDGDDETPANVDDDTGETTPPNVDTDTERFRSWSVTDLMAADLTFQWDATGMLVRPTYGLDTGELKTLKSYFGISRAIGLAAGVPILGHWQVPERRRVLYYSAEGGRVPFTRRFIRLCEAHDVEPRDLDGWLDVVFDAGPMDTAPFRDTLRAKLDEYEPHFVHLDPLYAFQAAQVDAHRVDQQGRMLAELQHLVAGHSDATLWITAHMNQTGGGFDLKRIAGAGTGEWGDSWCLLKHRSDPDVEHGRFRLALDIGSRQWGGATYSLDLNIGRFDADTGSHDGPITVAVHRGTPDADSDSDPDAAKRHRARRGVFNTARRARRPLSVTDLVDRSTGASKAHIRAEVLAMIDAEILVEDGVRKPEKGGPSAPLYRLAEGQGDG